MRKWIAAGVAVLLGGVALGLVARAQDGGQFRPGPEGHEFRGGFFTQGRGLGGAHRMGPRLLALLDNDRVKAALGLTDDQATHLRQIVVDTEKSSVKTGAEMAVRGIELRELLRADKPDRQAVMKKVDEISSLRQEMMRQHIDALLNAKNVLTPEQQKKIRSFIERRQGGDGPRARFSWRQTPPPDGGPESLPHPPEAPESPPNP